MKIVYVGLAQNEFDQKLRKAFRFSFHSVKTIAPEYLYETVLGFYSKSFDVIVLDERYLRYITDKIYYCKNSANNKHAKIVICSDFANTNWRRAVQSLKSGAVDYIDTNADQASIKKSILDARKKLAPD